MEFFINNWTLVLLALVSGTLLLFPALNGGLGRSLTAEAAVQLMNREKAVVIDIREPEEYAAGHLVGAKNVPLNQLETKLPSVVKNKALPVILACQSGHRSARALAAVKKLGYENAQNLSGGLGAWRAANLPVEKT